MLQTESPVRFVPAMLDRKVLPVGLSLPGFPPVPECAPQADVQYARRVLAEVSQRLRLACSAGRRPSLTEVYAAVDVDLQSPLPAVTTGQIVGHLDDQALALHHKGHLELLSWPLADAYLTALGWRLIAEPNLHVRAVLGSFWFATLEGRGCYHNVP